MNTNHFPDKIIEYLLFYEKNLQCRKKERKEICKEFESHMIETYEDCMAQGRTEEQAEKAAITNLGNQYEICFKYNHLFQLRHRKRKRLLFLVSFCLILIFSSIYGSVFIPLKQNNIQKYINFCNGVNNSKIKLQLSDELMENFYLQNYKNDSTLATAMSIYFQEPFYKKDYQMIVTDEFIITSERKVKECEADKINVNIFDTN